MNSTEHEAGCLAPQHILIAQNLPATAHYPAHIFSLETDVMLLEETQQRQIHCQPPTSQTRSFTSLREDLIAAKKLKLIEFSTLHNCYLEHRCYPTGLQLQNRYAYLMLTCIDDQSWKPRTYYIAMLLLTRQRYMGIIKSQIISSNALLAIYIPNSVDEVEQTLSIPPSPLDACISPTTPVTSMTPGLHSSSHIQPPVQRRRGPATDKTQCVKVSPRSQETGPRKVQPTRMAKKELCYAEDGSTDESVRGDQSPDYTPVTTMPGSSDGLDSDSDYTIHTSFRCHGLGSRRKPLAIHIPEEKQPIPSPTYVPIQPRQLFQTPQGSNGAPEGKPDANPATLALTNKARLDVVEEQLGDVQTTVLGMKSILSEKVQIMESSIKSLRDSLCNIQSLLQDGPLELHSKEKAHSIPRKRKFVAEETEELSYCASLQEERQRATNCNSDHTESEPVLKKPRHVYDTDPINPKTDLIAVAQNASTHRELNQSSTQRKRSGGHSPDGESVFSRLLGLLGGYFVRRKTKT